MFCLYILRLPTKKLYYEEHNFLLYFFPSKRTGTDDRHKSFFFLGVKPPVSIEKLIKSVCVVDFEVHFFTILKFRTL